MPPTRSTIADPFVGRGRELAALEAALGLVADGQPALLDVVGEPGIGKTTLMDQLTARAEAAGASVLVGRAQEFERDIPFGLIAAALGPHVRAMAPSDLNRLGDEARAELAAIFPEVAPAADAAAATRVRERYRLHRAVRELVSRIAGADPLVLIFDDLHWGDPASAELVASLVRSPPEQPVLIALARRATPLLAGLEVALDHAVLEDHGERLLVQPLSLDEAAPLLPTALPGRHRRELYERSGGNPFYIEHLGRAARRSPAAAATLEGAVAGDVPAAVAAVLAEELLPLSADAVLVLRAAAVVGDPFEISLTATVAEVDEAAALVALDELVAADLVRARPTPRTFAFRHPLLRSAAYSGVPAGWRLAAHGRAAAALQAGGAPAVGLAHHVEQCAAAGDADAARLLAAAAADIASRAPATAAQWLVSAVRVAPTSGPDAALLGELLPSLAMALVSAGRLEEALAAAQGALATLTPGGPGFVEVVAGNAAIERMLGRLGTARDRLTAALESLPPGEEEAATQLRLELIADASLGADFDVAKEAAEASLESASARGDATSVACATAALSFCSYSVGRFDEAAALCERAAELVRALPDESLAERLETVLYLGWAEWFMGRFDLAKAQFTRGLSVAQATGRATLVIEMSVGRILALVGVGDLVEAADVADATVEEARLMGNGHTLIWALFAQALALEPVAEPAMLVSIGEEALQVARPFEGSTIAAGCGWAYATGLVAAGSGERAVEVMLELQGGPGLPWFFPAHRAACYEVLTRAELLAGRTDEAARWVALARESSRESALPFAAAMADRAEAELALAKGDTELAARLAAQSADVAGSLGAAVDAARGRLLQGRALLVGGDRAGAGAVLRDAERQFVAMGATRFQAEAVRELRRIGRRVSRQGRGGQGDLRGAGALSSRERDVAELAAEGHTNRAIATELFLSEKTIETHLSNAFVKLGVKGRGELAAALAESGD